MGLILNLTESSSEPKYRQIISQVVHLVDQDVLRPGMRMPSSRELAEALGINRSTVYRAYQDLWALGYIESTPGSYSVIRKRARIAPRREPERLSIMNWKNVSSEAADLLYTRYSKENDMLGPVRKNGFIDFSILSPESSLFPLDEFRKCLNQVMVNFGQELLDYGETTGYGPLREYIADRMMMHSVHVSPDEIMITTGAQNGLELIMHLLSEAGDAVAFEAPTYSRAIDLFRMHGVGLVPIPMEQTGMNLDILERQMRLKRLKMVYTIPNFHNPTGITSIQKHRERLIALCEESGVPLVEDGFEEEMKYFGKAILPVKSMDKGGVVIYVGTFSKVLFPGLRVGWIAADRSCIERLVPLKRASSLSGNHLTEAALEQFCRRGYYDLHIKRMHRLYRKRMMAALKSLEQNLSGFPVSWKPPAGGYTIWLEIPGFADHEHRIVKRLLEKNVKIMPGSPYYIEGKKTLYLRLSVAKTPEFEIVKGIQAIREVIEEITS